MGPAITMPPSNFRMGVTAGGVVAIVACGSMIGARLKVDQEVKQARNSSEEARQIAAINDVCLQEKKQRFEASTADRIASLEAARDRLESKRSEIQRKIGDLKARTSSSSDSSSQPVGGSLS